mmetsp:Transcript_41596/g.97604  ORF Transcript_41596/g.97604 Transcript_41596/m.97604 type:complete len:243 (+) Transcript_41596:740-1468(+)
MPSTSTARLQRLTASATVSMNCCGLRLKSFRRWLSTRMRPMLRRVSWVRFCNSVRMSGSSMSSSLSTTMSAPLSSTAVTPASPISMPALRHCSRVLLMGGAWITAVMQSRIRRSLSNCTRYVVLYLMRSHRALNSGLSSIARRTGTCLRSSAFLISSLPETLRSSSRICARCASTSGGSARLPSLMARRNSSFTLPRASSMPAARKCSVTAFDSSKPSGFCVPSASATATPANRCSGTTPNW